MNPESTQKFGFEAKDPNCGELSEAVRGLFWPGASTVAVSKTAASSDSSSTMASSSDTSSTTTSSTDDVSLPQQADRELGGLQLKLESDDVSATTPEADVTQQASAGDSVTEKTCSLASCSDSMEATTVRRERTVRNWDDSSRSSVDTEIYSGPSGSAKRESVKKGLSSGSDSLDERDLCADRNTSQSLEDNFKVLQDKENLLRKCSVVLVRQQHIGMEKNSRSFKSKSVKNMPAKLHVPKKVEPERSLPMKKTLVRDAPAQDCFVVLNRRHPSVTQENTKPKSFVQKFPKENISRPVPSHSHRNRSRERESSKNSTDNQPLGDCFVILNREQPYAAKGQRGDFRNKSLKPDMVQFQKEADRKNNARHQSRTQTVKSSTNKSVCSSADDQQLTDCFVVLDREEPEAFTGRGTPLTNMHDHSQQPASSFAGSESGSSSPKADSQTLKDCFVVLNREQPVETDEQLVPFRNKSVTHTSSNSPSLFSSDDKRSLRGSCLVGKSTGHKPHDSCSVLLSREESEMTRRSRWSESKLLGSSVHVVPEGTGSIPILSIKRHKKLNSWELKRYSRADASNDTHIPQCCVLLSRMPDKNGRSSKEQTARDQMTGRSSPQKSAPHKLARHMALRDCFVDLSPLEQHEIMKSGCFSDGSRHGKREMPSRLRSRELALKKPGRLSRNKMSKFQDSEDDSSLTDCYNAPPLASRSTKRKRSARIQHSYHNTEDDSSLTDSSDAVRAPPKCSPTRKRQSARRRTQNRNSDDDSSSLTDCYVSVTPLLKPSPIERRQLAQRKERQHNSEDDSSSSSPTDCYDAATPPLESFPPRRRKQECGPRSDDDSSSLTDCYDAARASPKLNTTRRRSSRIQDNRHKTENRRSSRVLPLRSTRSLPRQRVSEEEGSDDEDMPVCKPVKRFRKEERAVGKAPSRERFSVRNAHDFPLKECSVVLSQHEHNNAVDEMDDDETDVETVTDQHWVTKKRERPRNAAFVEQSVTGRRQRPTSNTLVEPPVASRRRRLGQNSPSEKQFSSGKRGRTVLNADFAPSPSGDTKRTKQSQDIGEQNVQGAFQDLDAQMSAAGIWIKPLHEKTDVDTELGDSCTPELVRPTLARGNERLGLKSGTSSATQSDSFSRNRQLRSRKQTGLRTRKQEQEQATESFSQGEDDTLESDNIMLIGEDFFVVREQSDFEDDEEEPSEVPSREDKLGKMTSGEEEACSKDSVSEEDGSIAVDLDETGSHMYMQLLDEKQRK